MVRGVGSLCMSWCVAETWKNALLMGRQGEEEMATYILGVLTAIVENEENLDLDGENWLVEASEKGIWPGRGRRAYHLGGLCGVVGGLWFEVEIELGMTSHESIKAGR